MSGFFGFFNRNGKAVEVKDVDTMLDAMSGWEPDDSGTWKHGPVALGHTMLWNTPESKYEDLPLENDATVLTMDARIDNREELMKVLDLPDRPLEEIGDSEFILAAYQKWGEECPKHLLGDFAFAIWDQKKQQFFCARDHIGIKLFHFYLSDDLFVFSNDLLGILAHPNVPKDLDDEMVAKFLKWQGVRSKRSTFFEKIKKLPPATTLTISAAEMRKKEYWCIEDSPSIEYDSFEGYVEKLKELFDSAVEVRLRTNFPMASHLSGGIDSSPIAVFAARKLKKQEKKLYAFNWIDIPDHDEKYEYEAWNFSRRIAALEENIIHEEFSIDSAFMAKQYKEHNVLLNGTMAYWEENYVQNTVKNLGCRTLLSGWGGDEMISYNGYSYIPGLFSQGKIVQAFKYLFKENKYRKYSWVKFIKRTLSMMLPAWIIEFKEKMKKTSKSKIKKILKIRQDDPFWYKYLTKDFSTFMRTQSEKKYLRVSGVRKNQLAYYHNGHLMARIESWALLAFSHRFEYRYPLLDKRIVEFAMGIPEELFYPKEGKKRTLFKNAVSHLLPSDIVWFTKPHEVKVGHILLEKYTEAAKILQRESKREKYKPNKNKYLKDELMKQTLDTFDFEKSEVKELANMVMAIMLLTSKEYIDIIKKKGLT